jgi:hypothetical protein
MQSLSSRLVGSTHAVTHDHEQDRGKVLAYVGFRTTQDDAATLSMCCLVETDDNNTRATNGSVVTSGGSHPSAA